MTLNVEALNSRLENSRPLVAQRPPRPKVAGGRTLGPTEYAISRYRHDAQVREEFGGLDAPAGGQSAEERRKIGTSVRVGLFQPFEASPCQREKQDILVSQRVRRPSRRLRIEDRHLSENLAWTEDRQRFLAARDAPRD